MESSALREGPSLLVIGLGNELLADDSIGLRVVRELKKRVSRNEIAFEELSVGGLQLLDYLVGYRRCILIDAIVSGTHPAGTIHHFVQVPGGESIRLSSSHHVSLSEVLALGKILGASLPESISVYGIEPGDTTTFIEQCTGEVSQAIPQLVGLICRDLLNNESGCGNQTVLPTGSIPRLRMGNGEIINQPQKQI
ncbi:MAG: hydrogenase maturation protease [Ignavibacteria bacterium]|nr:hydrogenase maturation protease [Ignavibacteria bacterium]